MKFFLIVCLGLTLLSAESFKNSLIEEYLQKAKQEIGEEKYEEEFKKIRHDKNFKDAKLLEEQKYKAKGGKLDLRFYDEVIPLLSQSNANSMLTDYISLEISQHVWMQGNDTLNTNYLKDMAASLSKKRYCSGYYYHALFLWSDVKQSKAISVLEEGKENCKSPYRLLQIRKKLLKFKYIKKQQGKKNDK